MSAKPTREVDALDLALDSRRGALGPGDRRMFEQALGASAALRTAFEIGCDFDLASRVRPGDEALIARAAERALARGVEHRPRRLRFAGMLLAASLVMASAAAATRAVLHGRAAASAFPDAPPTPLLGGKLRAPVARASAVAALLPASATESSAARAGVSSAVPPVTIPLPPHASTRAGRELSPPSAPAVPVAENTPELLLQRAGVARRGGELAAARALYLELQSRFPGSNEARVSYVSLGKLLLAAGRAREADAAFVSYLRGGAGELREEALVGRADALFALGRVREESSVRQELIRLYPSSVYATRARGRLAEIERAQSAGSP